MSNATGGFVNKPTGGGGSVSTGGAGGTGGVRSPDSVTSAEDCVSHASGGADAVSCDYVRVDFSKPLLVANLDIEVTTSNGEVFDSPAATSSPFRDAPALVLKTTADKSEASGIALQMISGKDYSPEWVHVVVREGETTAADSQLPLTYSCVALTSDDWCWKAKTEQLEVMP